MNRMKHLLAVLFSIGVFGVLMGGACGDDDDSLIPIDGEDLCGPCGTLANGATTISGDARIDGLLKAVGTLGVRTGSIKANFDADVKELAAVFMTQAEIDASTNLVAELKAKIQAEITANVEGGLSVQYQPPKCSADISVAVEAQAQCEAQAGCTGECDPGSVSVQCEGSCEGSCEGTCEGGSLSCSAELTVEGQCSGTCEGSCELTGPAVACEGTCTGGCSVEAAGTCEGTCTGTCDGTCDFQNAEGQCKGNCDGTCTGKCEVQIEGSCSGECNGSCEFTPPSGQCQGTCQGECRVAVEAGASCEGEPPKCEGKCTGSCSAGCEGEITPPSCSVDCEASANCQAQASAQASASLECTPPSLEVAFNLKADLNAQAQAEFKAKMQEFKVKMIAILQGFAELKGLVQGDAELGVESPLAIITGEVDAIISGGVDGLGNFDIAIGLLPCVFPAIQEAGSILASAVGDFTATISAQAELAALVVSP
ncbi:MAG: hypothetical protein QNJ97_16595 [Myxococcota bacterium]|nr:hypothetical protein [Myxococcota bacterium]